MAYRYYVITNTSHLFTLQYGIHITNTSSLYSTYAHHQHVIYLLYYMFWYKNMVHYASPICHVYLLYVRGDLSPVLTRSGKLWPELEYLGAFLAWSRRAS